jgi:coenzyme F420 hydrogenase subunit beta
MRTEKTNTQKLPEEVSTLFNTVVKGDYYSGCGACASIKNSPIKMSLLNCFKT